MKKFLLLFAFSAFFCGQLTAATVTQTNLHDIFNAPLNGRITLRPVNVNALATGGGIQIGPQLDIAVFQGGFTNEVDAGQYLVYLPARAPFPIAVPDDTNTYNLTDLATNLTVFVPIDWPGLISTRVLAGANITVTTNNPGQANEQIIITGAAGGGGTGQTNWPASAITNAPWLTSSVADLLYDSLNAWKQSTNNVLAKLSQNDASSLTNLSAQQLVSFGNTNGSATNNFFIGGAGNATMLGVRNVGMGGFGTLQNLTNGGDNVAIGAGTMTQSDASGDVAVGNSALVKDEGSSNTALGYGSMQDFLIGKQNVSIGSASFFFLEIGTNNIAVGAGAGKLLPLNTSSNIMIGSDGTATDTNIIRLGQSQSDTYLVGAVHGNASGLTNRTPLASLAPSSLVDSNNAALIAQTTMSGLGSGNVTGSSLTSGNVITGAGTSAIQDSGTAFSAVALKTDLTGSGGTITNFVKSFATTNTIVLLATNDTTTLKLWYPTTNGNVITWWNATNNLPPPGSGGTVTTNYPANVFINNLIVTNTMTVVGASPGMSLSTVFLSVTGNVYAATAAFTNMAPGGAATNIVSADATGLLHTNPLASFPWGSGSGVTTNIPGPLFVDTEFVTNNLTVSNLNAKIITATNLPVLLANVTNVSLSPLVLDGSKTNVETSTTYNIPTNAAPLNFQSGTNLIPTGATYTLGTGRFQIHAGGVYTNTFATPVYWWLTNMNSHECAIVGNTGASPGGTTNKDFDKYIWGSSGDVISITNQFSPAAGVGVVVLRLYIIGQ